MPDELLETTIRDDLEQDSIQGRSRRAPWDSSNAPGIGPGFGDMFYGGNLILNVAQAADEVIQWSYYPMRRDLQLRRFYKSEGILAGGIYSFVARIASLPGNISGSPRKKDKAQDLIHGLDIGKVTLDMLTTDNGFFIERVGPGRPDLPLNPKLITQLAVMDSAQCWRTFDPDYPVIYINPYTGRYHKIHYSRIITGSSFPQNDELARGIGLCAVSRVLLYAQFMRDVAIFRHEKIGGRFTRGFGLINGITPKTFNETLNASKEKADAMGLTRYMGIPFLVTPSQEVKAQLLNLAALPDGYNIREDSDFYAAVLALAFGTDVREFWPAQGGGATKADATVQHEKARGKGIADVIGALEKALNWGVLEALDCEIEYDYTDDAEQMAHAQWEYQEIINVTGLQTAGNLTPQQGNAILVAKGILDPSILASISAAEQAQVATTDEPFDPTTGNLKAPGTVPQNANPLKKPPAPGSQTTPMPSGVPKPQMQTSDMMNKAVKKKSQTEQLHTRTQRYSRDLKAMIEDFYDDGYEDDLTDRLDGLREDFGDLTEQALTDTFGIGLLGLAATAIGIRYLQQLAESQSEYFDGLLSDLQDTATDEDSFNGSRDRFTSRTESYGGAAWTAGWMGLGDRQRTSGKQRIQWVLDDSAEHCEDCPGNAGVYDSFEQMESSVGLPGEQSCYSNCRCHLMTENQDGSFGTLEGLPTVYTQALVNL